MTQAQLADVLHVKQAAVSMIEEKELVPSADLVSRIRTWLDSGKGPRKASPRGPYKRSRSTH